MTRTHCPIEDNKKRAKNNFDPMDNFFGMR